MDKSRPAADRVRPILQAMERSIDAARRKRLLAGGVPIEGSPAPAPAVAPVERVVTPGGTDQPARLKARPKRATAFPPRQAG